MFTHAKWDSKLKQYSLWEQWDAIVGPAIAEQTRPLRWQEKTLVVGVKNSIWMQELKMMENELLQKIRQAQPDLKILGIHWRLLNFVENTESLHPRKAPPRG